MRKRVILAVLVLIVMISSIIYYFRDGGRNINAYIDANKLSAIELIGVAKPYVENYWGQRKYYIGKVSMDLNSNHEGLIEIWYKDDYKDKNGAPNIITVEIDTQKKKILRIIKQERNTKLDPGIINIEDWSIDSNDAVDIARNAFRDVRDFDFTLVYLSGNNFAKGGRETWDVSLINEKNNNAYYLEIDAYSGEVYKKEIK
jgi:hypothetical protein